MKQVYHLTILSLLLLAPLKAKQDAGGVQHFGVLREIMMELKLEANANLSDFKTKEHFYALGALEGLSGELMILDGKAFKTSIDDKGEKITRQSMSGGASLMVSAEVHEWTDIPVNKVLNGLGELETEVKALAEANGLDVSRPFPFMITGKATYLKSHVINAPGAAEQSHEAFKKSGVVDEYHDIESTILGFYSEQHRGVYTHHDSFVHTHVLYDGHASHIDGITLHSGITLKLPKTW